MTENKKLQKIFKVLRYLILLLLISVILALGLFFYYTWDLPRPETFTESPFIQSTKIYDRTGKVLLFNIYGEEKRTIIPFDKISDNLKRAVVSSEDARFYEHGGFDLQGLIRSVWVDLTSQSRSQGGSTITQQLIRSVYLTPKKTIERKVREIVLSIELEQKYSKDQILDWYLNKIPFGQNTYGAEAASQAYFNKPASDLSLAQAATLTALIPAPSYYSPYGSHKDELLARKNYVLQRMKDLGYITDDQLKQAKEEKIEFSEITTAIKAPHFVMYVQKYLNDKYGEDYLREKGLKVYTTIDWDLQSYVEQVLKDADQQLKSKKANNAAIVVMDPKTGEILALMGSKNFFTKSYPEGCDQKGNNTCLFNPEYDVATIGKRQPGSSFKPIVYATAFKEGYTPSTIVWDVKTEFNQNCSPDGSQEKDQNGLDCYHPQDYDALNRGPVSLRSALTQSLNIPAVKVLYLAGLNNSLQTAKDLGITTLNDPQRYGLSLVLGGGEVNLLEMTSAYSVFATEGLKIDPISILKIEDSNGNTIEENKAQPTKVLDTQVARLISNVLSDNNARAPIFGYNSPLQIPGYQVAAKTGTTQNFNDGWTMGYTPFATIGVWVGNNDNSPTKDEGVGIAAPIWNKVMTKIVTSRDPENFTEPDPIKTTNPALLGQIPQGENHDILQYVDRNNPTGPIKQNPANDPMYFNWEAGVINYLISKTLSLLY
ncbi:MAG: hypothetical protein A3D35_01575 [Candidatus Staskawiczbacteria bacterium RIFCSPHIGHO2_02_FULL_34_9]|uniref:Uncharacterized protein n=1 Tax=Candidatus Staskawiczbacteria bacterium RIFCSPHIGHO2_02_FULL_34_9 TaxID=1802206 RepID=A0A1G2HWU8_9BACT|nr:MAG: hypothetical protein A3D35_01575 [Candidatus Staskawiczbacteria bacterium RIFCSPHIGHO2_02_FULL_34_9]